MTLSTICSNTGMALLFLLAAVVSAQQISPSNNSADIPSNNSADIPPYNSSPRFWINGSDFDSFEVVPLGWYQSISQSGFRNMMYEGRLQHVDGSNANNPLSDAIVYIRCDPDAYNGVLGASDILTMAANAQPTNPIVVYSTESNHCAASNLRSLSANNGVFSTLDPVLAATVESQIRNKSSGVPCTVTPDLNSYQSASSNGYGSSSSSNGNGRPGPTTAVAMIVLYTITGLITALFVCIIITGAVRAHRHPERYGPMNSPGRARRSRAKGIARAMLDTIPIVKFGEKDESATAKKEAGDVELASVASVHTAETANAKPVASAITESEQPAATSAPSAATANADGTDESGQLGCSICTEDFTRGEEVRVLPCNHKFHPECVDPWLLNVSGTCPLCRVDLRPREEQDQRDSIDGEARRPSGNALDDFLAPPLGGRRASNANGRRDTTAFAALRSVVAASREDRIAALRRYRQQRRENGASAQQGEEGGRVTRRLRERFRIRTRRQGEDTAEEVRS